MSKTKKIGIAIGLFFLYVLLSVYMEVSFKICFNSSNIWISNISLILSNVFVLLVISLVFIPTLVKQLKSFKKEYVKIAYKNWFWGLLIMFVCNILISQLAAQNISTNEATNRNLLYNMPIYAITVMVFVAPIIEELIFRLSLKDIFNNKWVYCTVSGLTFGLMHLISATSAVELLYTISYGALGFFFAKSVYETNNIYSSIIAHMTHNGLIISILLLGNSLGV